MVALIHFGWYSLVLLFGALNGIVVAAMLLARAENRVANRVLAGLMLAFVLRLVPFVIGYAGFYDAYPWLSFAPFDLSLAYGPLIWLYVARLSAPALPRRWWLHLAPAGLQLAYLTVVFVQPLGFKNAWDARVHEPLVDPLLTGLTYLSLAVYLAASVRRYARYDRWLADNVSDRDERQLTWARNFLAAFSLTVAVMLGFDLLSAAVGKLSYFQYFGAYVWYAALVYYLALEGWRNAGRVYPLVATSAVRSGVPAAAAVPPTAQAVPAALEADGADETDWTAGGARWHDALARSEAWRDPQLTLALSARTLGTTPAHLSRALNAGLGRNFNETINRLRVEAVKAALRDSAGRRDLLAIAFDAGFSSKASFNRAFKAYAGVTPSRFRETCGEEAQLGIDPVRDGGGSLRNEQVGA